MHKKLARVFGLWIPFVVATSGLFLFSYWAIQQSYRVGANDPQVEMAEDGAAALNAGASPASIVPRTNAQSAGAPSIDITMSLAPWIAVFDASGTPLESSGMLGGDALRLPQGVFDRSTWKAGYAEWGVGLAVPPNETRFTWQPSPDARQAVVLARANNGYFVAAGRSLREVESREATLTHGAALLWSATELGTLIVLLVLGALSWL